MARCLATILLLTFFATDVPPAPRATHALRCCEAYERAPAAFAFAPGTSFQGACILIFPRSRSRVPIALRLPPLPPLLTALVWKEDADDPDLVARITAANFSVVASPSSHWYLDNLAAGWDAFYYYRPAANLSEAQTRLVVGGEAVMFGEHVDASNLDSVTQPRAAAVAERLWSDRAALPSDPTGQVSPAGVPLTDKDVTQQRLALHRCRLVQRGVRAAPVAPSYCGAMLV